ncbi:MAG: protocatechuate 3,4-dioxygenase subunit alpha [Pseudomonadota bacterium]
MAKTPLPETASQTAGPYVHIGLAPKVAGLERPLPTLGSEIAGPDVPGARITLEGCVFDGDGKPVTDAMIELWQADARGRFAGSDGCASGFQGWGREAADFMTGLWRFETIKPGSVGAQAPHLAIWIVARGINIGLHTRAYFEDEGEANASDPVLVSLVQNRRAGLIARHVSPRVYRFDIHLQGPQETVFFDL